jgi:hypothetical protein
MGANSLSALGVINVLAGLFMASIVAIRVGKAGLVAWLIVVIAMLPVVSWAEVDLLWMALLVAAVFADHAWVSSICWLMAISVSPVAILAGPILVGLRDEGWRYYLVLTVVSVALLSLIGGLDWWIGDRGVLTAQGVNPLRTLGEWSRYCPWLVVPFVGPWLGRHRAAYMGYSCPVDGYGWSPGLGGE